MARPGSTLSALWTNWWLGSPKGLELGGASTALLAGKFLSPIVGSIPPLESMILP